MRDITGNKQFNYKEIPFLRSFSGFSLYKNTMSGKIIEQYSKKESTKKKLEIDITKEA